MKKITTNEEIKINEGPMDCDTYYYWDGYEWFVCIGRKLKGLSQTELEELSGQLADFEYPPEEFVTSLGKKNTFESVEEYENALEKWESKEEVATK